MKVLDFGLAKALDEEPAAASATNSPTLTMNATRAGVLLGTAAYMSPEQGKGKQADRRSDIWSFGAVLYEIVTGKPPFTGETVGDILAAVIKDEPKLDAVPAEVRGLIGRCLTKDPRQRLQAIGEARIALENPTTAAETKYEVIKRSRPWAWMIATGMLISGPKFCIVPTSARGTAARVQNVVAASGKSHLQGDQPSSTFPRWEEACLRGHLQGEGHALGARSRFAGCAGAHRNGRRRRSLLVPDSRTIAFFADNKLKTIEADGGPVLTISDLAGLARGGSWSRMA